MLRDVLSFVGGWTLIFLEAQRPEVREAVLLVGGAAIGIPGFAVAATSILEAMVTRRVGTGGSQSQPPEQAESLSS